MKKTYFFTLSLFIFFALSGFAYANEYVVKPGDTFWDISKNMKVGFEEIKKVNRDRLKFTNNFDLIFPGQVILIPNKGMVKNTTASSLTLSEKKYSQPVSVSVTKFVAPKLVAPEISMFAFEPALMAKITAPMPERIVSENLKRRNLNDSVMFNFLQKCREHKKIVKVVMIPMACSFIYLGIWLDRPNNLSKLRKRKQYIFSRWRDILRLKWELNH